MCRPGEHIARKLETTFALLPPKHAPSQNSYHGHTATLDTSHLISDKIESDSLSTSKDKKNNHVFCNLCLSM